MKLKKLSFFFFAVITFVLLIAATSLSVSAEKVAYPVEGGNIYFDPETGAIVGCDPTITRADIPEYINGTKVIGIGDFAFLQSRLLHNGKMDPYPIVSTPSLTHVSLPDTIEYIGMCPFYGTSIESIVLPKSLKFLREAVAPSELGTAGSFFGGPEIAYYRGTKDEWKYNVDYYGYDNTCTIVYDYKCEGIYGHEYNDWIAVKLPTCTEKGEDIRTCSLCGESETRTVSARHTWSDVITVVKPSCTTTGSGVKSCVNCDVSQTVVIPIEHSFGEWQVIQDYGCIEGIKRRTCTICKTKEEEMLPATEDHSWSDWKEDTAATCTVEGKESHYCLNCNYTESRTVPTNDNHSWSDWNVTIAPTAESEGKEVRLCTVCGATETRTVSITGEIAYPVKGGVLYFDTETGTITGADIVVRDLNIPAKINGIKVTAIADRAFARYTDMQYGVEVYNSFNSVTLPDTLTSIGNSAFFGVKDLKSLTIPGSVKTIGKSAFEECYDLEEVVISAGVEEIGNDAFSQCYELKSVTIGAAKIGDSAFWDCLKLNSLTLLDGVESVGSYAFAATGITELVFPASVRTIGECAFEICSNLVNVTLNEGLETIGAYAFADTGIEWVDIPLSVVSIGENAFDSTPYEDALNSCVNHTWDDLVVTEATCIKDGVKTRTCLVCSKTETVVIPATGVHVYGEWVVIENPTCVNNGTQKRTCTNCTATEPAAIPATGVHFFGEWKLTTPAACDLPGEETRECENCDAAESREIEPIAHTEIHVEAKDPTCVEDGNIEYYYCSVCGYHRTPDGMPTNRFNVIVPMTEVHVFGEWTVTVEPTVFEVGEKTRKCENCDITETEELAKLDMTNPFKDVKEGMWYTDGILYCYHKGYMAGVFEDTFGYKDSVTRAMFVTILAKIDGADTSSYTETSFSDVKAGQWYSASIEWAYKNGYAAGIGDGVFGYNQNVSREQLAMFLYTYSQKNGVDVSRREDISGFADVDRIHGYALDAVKWAVHANLISGTSDTTLSPRDSATRAEIALIVMNYVENVKG